jgi:hypothetical protein
MMQRQLTTLTTRLSVAVEMIDPLLHQRDREKQRRAVFDRSQVKQLEREHKSLLSRRAIIEERKVREILFYSIFSVFVITTNN